jgi:SAM-dependent methyltransferase
MPQRSQLWEFEWRWLPGRNAVDDNDLLRACADLYSTEYGKWGTQGPRPGEQIAITPEHLRNLLDTDGAWLACALQGDQVVGYCAALRFDLVAGSSVAWVTQLVVHSTFRKLGLATHLLYGIWQFSDCHAWGLVTASPYAVRALETATRRPCRASLIKDEGAEVLAALAEQLDYLPANFVVDDKGARQPRVNTRFFVDHTDVEKMKRKAGRRERPWALGKIHEGEEWFACTFGTQEPDSLDRDRLRQLLTGADSIWLEAYEGMTLDQGHRWHSHTEEEVDFITRALSLSDGVRIIDVGCGDGRHAKAFAKRGHQVVGVDMLSSVGAQAGNRNLTFLQGDARKHLPGDSFELALCLYDVLGSSASQEDDTEILRNLHRSLKPGGHAVISVMNREAVLPYMDEGHRPDQVDSFVAALERLAPSDTMESSGDVFDPEHLLYYDGIFYRKEQFSRASWRLPTELVVRDRRFAISELRDLVARMGFEAREVHAVQAGGWSRKLGLDQSDQRAKELLVIARKP